MLLGLGAAGGGQDSISSMYLNNRPCMYVCSFNICQGAPLHIFLKFAKWFFLYS